VAVFDTAACAELIDDVTTIAARAAGAILRLAGSAPRRKPDGSPVTAADEASEAVIYEGLEDLAPGISIVSEERSPDPGPHAGSLASGIYFLVDPLDGTQEFIAGRDEYTVNIALISAGTPLLGVVAAPAAGLIWRGVSGRGADRLALGAKDEPIAIRTRPPPPSPLVMVSRSHLDTQTKTYLAKHPHSGPMACGSSIKFCRIAEGAADLYPRLAPTHDWDIAAGHALVVAAGGEVSAADGEPLIYGTPNRLISDFIARGKPAKR
jgi:3'(2'), 5'-bisphosphate nucleotidase